MIILNLTQYPATPDQIAAGVFDLPTTSQIELQSLLTFDKPPTQQEILARAEQIARLAAISDLATIPLTLLTANQNSPLHAMIGGALWLMAPLATALREQDIEPVFAFSMTVFVPAV